MLCPKCKREIADNVQFCPECGTGIAAKKKKKPLTKKWWFWLIIIFLFIACIGTIGGEDDVSSNPTEIISENINIDNPTDNTTSATSTTSAITEDEYKASCESVAYKDIARLPDDYKGKQVVFTGEVIQVQESSWSKSTIYRINVTKDQYGYWDDTVYVTYKLPEGAPRILEDDIVTFYGQCEGTHTYETVLGSNITIPAVSATYIDIN